MLAKMRLLPPPSKTPTISSARIFSSTPSEIKQSACAISSPQLASVPVKVFIQPLPPLVGGDVLRPMQTLNGGHELMRALECVRASFPFSFLLKHLSAM